MQAKEYLCQARAAALKVSHLQKRLVDTYQTDSARLAAESALSVCQDESMRRQCVILKAVSLVPDSRSRILIQSRYLDAMTWTETAAAIGCSSMQAQRLHTAALQAFAIAFQEVMPEARAET